MSPRVKTSKQLEFAASLSECYFQLNALSMASSVVGPCLDGGSLGHAFGGSLGGLSWLFATR